MNASSKENKEKLELLSFYESKAPNIDSSNKDYQEFYNLLKKDYKIINAEPTLCGLYGSWIFEGWKKGFFPKEFLIKCEILLKEAIENIPTNKSYLYNLALCLREIDKTSEAIEIGMKLIEIDESISNLMLLGNCYADLNNTIEAVKFYKKCLQIDSNQPELLYNLGSGLRSAGDYKGSLDCFDKLIKTYPTSGTGYFGKGTVLIETESLEEAEKYLLKAREYEGVHEGISKHLSFVYNKMGRKEEARKEEIQYGGAITLNKDNVVGDKIQILLGEENERN